MIAYRSLVLPDATLVGMLTKTLLTETNQAGVASVVVREREAIARARSGLDNIASWLYYHPLGYHTLF